MAQTRARSVGRGAEAPVERHRRRYSYPEGARSLLKNNNLNAQSFNMRRYCVCEANYAI